MFSEICQFTSGRVGAEARGFQDASVLRPPRDRGRGETGNRVESRSPRGPNAEREQGWSWIRPGSRSAEVGDSGGTLQDARHWRYEGAMTGDRLSPGREVRATEVRPRPRRSPAGSQTGPHSGRAECALCWLLGLGGAPGTSARRSPIGVEELDRLLVDLGELEQLGRIDPALALLALLDGGLAVDVALAKQLAPRHPSA